MIPDHSRPLPVPTSLLIDREGRLAAVYKGAVSVDRILADTERVIAALEQAGWVQAKAARLLGMTPRQIGYRIQTLNIKMRQI